MNEFHDLAYIDGLVPGFLLSLFLLSFGEEELGIIANATSSMCPFPRKRGCIVGRKCGGIAHAVRHYIATVNQDLVFLRFELD